MSLVIILGLCLPYFIGWMLLERLLCSRHCSGCGNRAVNRGDGAGGGPSSLGAVFSSDFICSCTFYSSYKSAFGVCFRISHVGDDTVITLPFSLAPASPF